MTPAEELVALLGTRVGEVDGRRIVPMLCERETSERALLDRDFVYELKLDGVRIVADKRVDRVALTYRKSRDATKSYPEVAAAVAALAEARVVLDGEVVAFDDAGRPDFQKLASRIQSATPSARKAAASSVPVVYVVFDVLAVGDRDLRGLPLEARKEILGRIVPPHQTGAVLRYHPTFDDGEALFRLCAEHQLEGVVAKRRGSIYRVGERTTDWLKIKRELDADLVVVAWTEGEGRRARMGALDLGSYDPDGRLILRGRVGSGLDEDTIDALLARLAPLEVERPVAIGTYPPKKRHHVRPELVVSVRYGGFATDDGEPRLRFPVFRGVRPDVSPEDCTLSPENVRAEPTRRLHVTGVDQVLLADGTTKRALCKYYEAVAAALVPLVKHRPCAFVRPEGPVLWPPPKRTPDHVRTIALRVGTREIRGFLVDDVSALVFAVDSGCVSLTHGPFAEGAEGAVDSLLLRVASAVRANAVVGAEAVREVASAIGVPAFVKTAGESSYDVLLSTGRIAEAQAGPLAALVAEVAVELATRRSMGGASKEQITIGAVESTVAPFAACAPYRGSGVVVSVPLGWEELAVAPAAFGWDAARERATSETDMNAVPFWTGAASGRSGDVARIVEALERLLVEIDLR